MRNPISYSFAQFVGIVALLGLNRCGLEKNPSDPDAVAEPNAWYVSHVPARSAHPFSLQKNDLQDGLDARGVGDSGVNVSGLAHIPNRWQGDLSFVNFESVVSAGCGQKNLG